MCGDGLLCIPAACRGVCARYGASKSAQLRFRFVKWNMSSFFGILLVVGIIAIAATPVYVNVLFDVRFVLKIESAFLPSNAAPVFWLSSFLNILILSELQRGIV